MKTEKIIKPFNGYIIVVLIIITFLMMLGSIISQIPVAIIALAIVFVLLAKGLVIIGPNDSKVLLLFGNYKGTVKQNGLFWVNPLYSRTTLSLKARNFESETIKVNDKMGNPILFNQCDPGMESQ